MNRLHRDSELRTRMGEAGPRRAVRFTARMMGRQYHALLTALCERAASGGGTS